MWLFTRSDFKTVVYPATVSGIFNALSGALFPQATVPSVSSIIIRVPRMLLWIWLNLLVEVLANQRLHKSILEDSINKPWRPLPTNRLTPQQARQLLLTTIPISFLYSCVVGGTRESIVLMTLTWIYNDLGGADEHFLIRNLLNACGLLCFTVGATIVATGHTSQDISLRGYSWLAIIGAVILSTVQTQDMADMEGDAKRNRKTFPLVYGEGYARWSIAIGVPVWSVSCPAFWKLNFLGYIPSTFIGCVIGLRILLLTTTANDEATWRMWCVWMITIYLLPLLKGCNAIQQM